MKKDKQQITYNNKNLSITLTITDDMLKELSKINDKYLFKDGINEILEWIMLSEKLRNDLNNGNYDTLEKDLNDFIIEQEMNDM